MKRFHDWTFPIALAIAWVVAAGYAVSELGSMDRAFSSARSPAAVHARLELHRVVPPVA